MFKLVFVCRPQTEEFDLAGLDETWTDSQMDDPGPSQTTNRDKDAAGDDDSDSDMSDIIPQYDGANDEDGKLCFVP